MNEQLHATSKDDLGKWWAPLHRVPHTIDHPTNYVLYPAELAEYHAALSEIVVMVEQERDRVRSQLRWMERGHIMWHEAPRLPYTLSQALTFLHKKGEQTNRILKCLNAAVLRRRNTNQEESK